MEVLVKKPSRRQLTETIIPTHIQAAQRAAAMMASRTRLLHRDPRSLHRDLRAVRKTWESHTFLNFDQGKARERSVSSLVWSPLRLNSWRQSGRWLPVRLEPIRLFMDVACYRSAASSQRLFVDPAPATRRCRLHCFILC